MNDTTNPSLIERLLDALSITGSVKTASSIIIALGVILICGFLMTRLTKLVKLPNVTAYIVTGILIGPSVINLIPKEFISRTDFLSDIALAFIAFTAGQFFKKEELRKGIGKIVVITLFEALFSFAFVFSLCFFAFGLKPEFSLILAAISSATSPTSTIMTIKQTKSKGNFVNSLIEVIALDGVIALLLYSISMSICVAASTGNGVDFMDILLPILKNLLCLAIGVGFGFALRFLISSKRTTDNRLIIVVAILFLFCGICSILGQSPLLGCIAIGMIYTNTAKEEEKLFAQVNYFIPPIMLVFFVRSGMNLNFSVFGDSNGLTSTVPLIVIVLAYFVGRLVGKFSGSFLGSLATRQPKQTRNFLWMGLIPQSSVAIALATLGARTFTSIGKEAEGVGLLTIVLAASILFEIVGPGCAKLGLYLTKSYGHDIDVDAPESAVKHEVVEDEGSSKEIDLLAAQINHISKEIKELAPEEAEEQAFTEAAEEYENEVFIRNHRGFINRK